jgi:hypothetical protein
MLTSLLKRWADDALLTRLAKLELELAQERARNRILQTEVDSLASVVARDRARINAEAARYARRQVGDDHGR